MVCFSRGNNDERYTSSRHQTDTKANWIMVKVIGIGRAFKMDFEDVFVRAEVKYQITHKVWNMDQSCHSKSKDPLLVDHGKRHTTSRYETGARSASASSCALALTLPLRVRIVEIASLILFRGRCLEFLNAPLA